MANANEFAWQRGYAAAAIAPDRLAVVLRYIDRQEEHHQSVIFKEEYLVFIRKAGLEQEVDERHIWE